MQRVKTILKLAFCWGVYHSGILHVFIRRVFLKRKNFPAVIINYHSFVTSLNGVMEIDSTVAHRIDDFKKEISFLKRYFDVVSLDQIVDRLKTGKLFERPAVAITVDDGVRDNFDILFPVLKERGVPVTIFLTTGVIGTNQKIWVDRLSALIASTKQETLTVGGLFEDKCFSFRTIEERRRAYELIVQRLKDVDMAQRDIYLKKIEEALGHAENGQRLMLNWDEVRLMQKNEIYFGAHTVNHPILTHMPLEDAKKEIADSKQRVERELGIPVKHFAYPNGRPQDFNEALRRFCQDIGFDSVCTCNYGNNSQTSDIWGLKRIGSEVPISLFALNVLRSFLVRS